MQKQLLATLLALALGSSLLPAPAFAVEPAKAAETVLQQEDPAGTLSFANLDARIRKNNPSLLALDETIASVEALDYDKMYEDLLKQMNKIANLQGMLLTSGQKDSYLYTQLQQSYNAMEQSFDAIKKGELQADNAGVIRQLKAAQNQAVMAGESLYVALFGMEIQRGSLKRSLAALDRTVKELELRYQLGQVSALQVQQARASRTSLASGLDTLEMNLHTYRMQLEQMVGAPLTGTISLGELPQVESSAIEAMKEDEDLVASKKVSYELYAAQKTLDDAKEAYEDAGDTYHYNEKKYQFISAKHTWQAAQYTYAATTQNFEMRFHTKYLQVKDYLQILNASRISLEAERASYAATEKKYQQGKLSQNALLDAKDKVTAAEESVQTASINLFSAYHTYRWAVDYGILN